MSSRYTIVISILNYVNSVIESELTELVLILRIGLLEVRTYKGIVTSQVPILGIVD